MKTAFPFFIRQAVALLVLLLGVAVRAQQADNPVYYQLNPTVTLTVPEQIPAGPGGSGFYSGSASFLIWDEALQAMSGPMVSGPAAQHQTSTYTVVANPVRIFPNKDYVCSITATQGSVAKYSFFVPTNHGFVVYINGIATPEFVYSNPSATAPSTSPTFTLRIALPNDYAKDAEPDYLPAGAATSLVADKPIMYFGLGGARTGRSAGVIGFRAQDFANASFFTTAALYFSANSTFPGDEVYRIYNANSNQAIQVLRQVLSRETLVDIRTISADPLTASYALDFYPRSAVTSQPTVPATPFTFSGSPFVTYTVSKNTSSGIKVTRLEDGITWETSLVLSGTTWTLSDWRVQGSGLNSTVVTAYTGSNAATVTHGGPASGLAGDSDFSWSKSFTTYTWGKELAQTLLGSGETTPVVSNRSYYTSSAASGATGAYKGLTQWITNPDGTWAKHDYYVGDSTNAKTVPNSFIQRTYRPWLDTTGADTSGTTAAAATTANSAYEDYTYTFVAKGADATGAGATNSLFLPASVTSYAPGGTLLKKTTWDYNTRVASLNGYFIWSSTQKDFSDSTQSLVTTSKYFVPLNPAQRLDDQPVSRSYPDGRMDSYAYYRGNWNSASKTFEATFDGDERLTLCFHGQNFGGTSVTSWTSNGIAWSIDPVSMVANRSTVTETVIDRNGRRVFSAENIYTSSGTIERLSGILNVYDSHGRITDVVDIMRSVGGTLYKTHRDYSATLLTAETSPDGVVTKYEYDSLLRLIKKTTGDGGTAPYPATVQSTTYDGINRPVAAYSCSCGTAPTRYYYDSAGRLKIKSDPSPNSSAPDLLTTYSYSSLTSSQTTLPTGATSVSTRYADGRPKSTTGSAQPPVYYDYTANGAGLLVTQKHDNNSTMANGWSQDQSDLLGRVTKHSAPTFGWTSANSNIVDVTSNYDLTTGLLASRGVTYRATGATMSPKHLYVYDSGGRLTDEGLDLNENNSLNTASNDRFTHYDNYFAADTSGWRNVSTTSTFATSLTSSAATPLATVVTRLTGFNAGVLHPTYGLMVGDVVTTDVNGQTAYQKDFVLSSSRQRYTTATLSSSGNVGWSKSINGYPAESQAISGVRVQSEYDALGRIVTVKNRWNGSSYDVADTSTYFGNTKFVADQTVNGIRTSFAYAWGTDGTSTVTTTDAATNYTYTVYNSMGLPAQVGGTAASPVKFTYDAIGRRTTMTTWRNGNATDAAHWPTGTGDTTTWSIEAATGLITSRIAADNSQVDFTYTALGQPYERKLARLVPNSNPARRVTTTYAYFDGSSGTNADVSYRTQELRSVSYNDGVTPAVSYTYNRSGLPAVITDGATAGHTFAYAAGQPFRVASETLSSFYSGRVETQQYDAARPAGFTLSGAGNVGTDLNQTFTYNSATGLPATLATTPANQTSRSYAFAWKPGTELFSGYTTAVSGGNFALGYDYQASTNLRSQVKASFGSATVSQADLTYNALGQIQAVKQSGTAFGDYYLDPTDVTKNFVTNAYAYDAMGQLQTKAMYRATSGAPAGTDELPGRRFEYRYDAMGNRLTAGATATDVAHGGTADNYTVNNLNQYFPTRTNNTVRVLGTVGPSAALKVAVGAAPSTSKVDRSWAGDIVPGQGSTAASGTATVFAALPGTPDLIRTDSTKRWFIPPSPQSFTYDTDGNLTGDQVWTYGYDAENRLISLTTLLPAGAGHKRWNLSFAYDYLGRRVQKTATNLDTTTDPTASYTRRYLYNGWNLVAEFSFNTQLSTLNLVRSYTWGLDLAGSFSATGGVGALLQITVHDTTNKNYFAAYDQNGNVAALTRDDGLLAAAYEYSPFGEPLRAEVSAADATMADNPFRFSTKYTDVESGLVYYGLRYYSPDLGRFINQDPIQEAGGLNLYGFVGNSPVNSIDRLGLKTVCIEVPAKGGRDGQTTKVCATDDGYIPANSKYVATVSGGLNSDGSFYGSINTIPRSDIYDSGAGSHGRNSGTGNGGNNSAFQLPTFYVNGTNDFDAIGWYNFRNAIDSSSAPNRTELEIGGPANEIDEANRKIIFAGIRVNGMGMGPKFSEGKAAIINFASALESPLSPFSVIGGIPNPVGDITEKIDSVQLAYNTATSAKGGGDVTDAASNILNGIESVLNRRGPFEAYTVVQTAKYQPVPYFVFWTINKWVADQPVYTRVQGPLAGGYYDSTKSAARDATSALREQLNPH